MCTQHGYTWDWRFSSNSTGIAELDPDNILPPTQRVVYQLAQTLPYRDYKFHIYMDNLFTTIPLLLKLRGLGIGGCGTTRRYPAELEVDGSDLPWNTVTGGPTADKQVLALQWEDQKSVRCLTTIHRLEDKVEKQRKRPRITSTRGRSIRSCFGDRERMVIPIPTTINDYNHGKVGVDLADQYRAAYFTQPTTRRNWPPLLFWLLDISIINSFLLFTNHPNHHQNWASGRARRVVSHKDYRLQLAYELATEAQLESDFGSRQRIGTRYPSQLYERSKTHLCYSKQRGITSFPLCANLHGRHSQETAMSVRECVSCRFRLRNHGQKGRARSTRLWCQICHIYICSDCFQSQ